MGNRVSISVQFKGEDKSSEALDVLRTKFQRYIRDKSSATPYIDWYYPFRFHKHGDMIEYYCKNFQPAWWLKEGEFEFEFSIWDDNEETAKEIYPETEWCHKTNSSVTHETSVCTLSKKFAEEHNLEFINV